jgi:hypothetical protein
VKLLNNYFFSFSNHTNIEKITFFFAWKSYLTCVMLFLAVPGVVLQIYIIIANDWTTWLLPLWVFYILIWNSIVVEYWKRKTSEINYRWGSLDEMNANEQETRAMRAEFSGYECINNVTGEPTKRTKAEREEVFYLLFRKYISFFKNLFFAIQLNQITTLDTHKMVGLSFSSRSSSVRYRNLYPCFEIQVSLLGINTVPDDCWRHLGCYNRYSKCRVHQVCKLGKYFFFFFKIFHMILIFLINIY